MIAVINERKQLCSVAKFYRRHMVGVSQFRETASLFRNIFASFPHITLMNLVPLLILRRFLQPCPLMFADWLDQNYNNNDYCSYNQKFKKPWKNPFAERKTTCNIMLFF